MILPVIYHYRGFSIRHADEFIAWAHSVAHPIEVRFDKTPPTTPQDLQAATVPTVLLTAKYLYRPFLKTHVMPPFDSTGGDLLVVSASSHNGVTLTPSDNFHNTWIALTPATTPVAGLNLRSQLWYIKNPKVGPGHIVTMTLSTPQSLVISVFVVKGADLADPIDAFSVIGDDGNTETLYPTSPKIVTSHPDDLLIGFGKSAATELWGAGPGFAFQPTASSDFLVGESGMAATPGVYTSSFVFDTHSNWQAWVVAVRPATPVATPGPITLTWQPSTDNVGVASYEVDRCAGKDCEDFESIGTAKGSAFVDATPARSPICRYRVRAADEAANRSPYSNTIAVPCD